MSQTDLKLIYETVKKYCQINAMSRYEEPVVEALKAAAGQD